MLTFGIKTKTRDRPINMFSQSVRANPDSETRPLRSFQGGKTSFDGSPLRQNATELII